MAAMVEAMRVGTMAAAAEEEKVMAVAAVGVVEEVEEAVVSIKFSFCIDHCTNMMQVVDAVEVVAAVGEVKDVQLSVRRIPRRCVGKSQVPNRGLANKSRHPDKGIER